MDEEILNETLADIVARAGLDVSAFHGDLLGNLDALKGLVIAKRATETTAWEASNLDLLDEFLARYKPETG